MISPIVLRDRRHRSSNAFTRPGQCREWRIHCVSFYRGDCDRTRNLDRAANCRDTAPHPWLVDRRRAPTWRGLERLHRTLAPGDQQVVEDINVKRDAMRHVSWCASGQLSREHALTERYRAPTAPPRCRRTHTWCSIRCWRSPIIRMANIRMRHTRTYCADLLQRLTPRSTTQPASPMNAPVLIVPRVVRFPVMRASGQAVRTHGRRGFRLHAGRAAARPRR